jgi:hypothetical protein
MGLGSQAIAMLAAGVAAQVRRPSRRRGGEGSAPGWRRWLGEPRNAVLVVLGLALLVGGGRRLLQGWRARRAVGRLNEPDVTPEDVEAATAHGRAGLMDLFRILGTAKSEPLRLAAGHALAVLWARDELIAEEEKALIRRGYTVAWHARGRYPRALKAPIPIAVTYGVPFLREGDAGVGPANLEWSHRILGARRAGLESFSPWTAGPGRAEFAVIPDDFETNGPHKLILHARARTAGLTESWELDLPHIPFTIEFDPRLAVEALFTLLDESRAEAIARAVRLERSETDESEPAHYLDLSDEWALRDPPVLAVATPLPCDLAHKVEIEWEGLLGGFAAGAVVLSRQRTSREVPESVRRFPLGPLAPLPPGMIDRPGARRLRAILTADPDRGWADPDVRSIWPGTITTDWIDVAIVRR